MKQSILVVFILAMMTIVLAPSASAITVDPLKLQAEQPVKKEKPRPKPKLEVKIPKIEPPIEYITISGDTLTKIAESRQTTVQRLWQKNTQLSNPDLLNIGDKLIIPTASEVLADRPITLSNVAHAPQAARPVIPGNGYVPNNCTWYVKTKRPDIGNFWGDANQWGYSASAAGYIVNSTPSAGSIGVATGYTHVVFIEAVNGDGTVFLSEMNYGQFGVVTTRTAPISEFVYIH